MYSLTINFILLPSLFFTLVCSTYVPSEPNKSTPSKRDGAESMDVVTGDSIESSASLIKRMDSILSGITCLEMFYEKSLVDAVANHACGRIPIPQSRQQQQQRGFRGFSNQFELYTGTVEFPRVTDNPEPLYMLPISPNPYREYRGAFGSDRVVVGRENGRCFCYGMVRKNLNHEWQKCGVMNIA